MSAGKALLIGGIGVIAIVGGVSAYSYVDTKLKSIKHNTPITGDVTITQIQADGYASRVINQINGWSGGVFSNDDKVFTELLNMSDANLIFVSDCFATDFTDQNDGKSFAKWIDDNDYSSLTWDDSAKLVTRLQNITKQ